MEDYTEDTLWAAMLEVWTIQFSNLPVIANSPIKDRLIEKYRANCIARRAEIMQSIEDSLAKKNEGRHKKVQ